MDNNEESRIERLSQQLYSRESASKKKEEERSSLTSDAPDEPVATDWQDTPKTQGKLASVLHSGTLVKWSLIGAVIFFLISFIIATLIFLNGSGIVSSENVDIRVLAPVSIGGGDKLDLEVVIQNKNNVALEDVDVQLSYPEGARVFGSPEQELVRDRKAYGPITPGETVRQTFTASLFGEQDTTKEILITAQYRVAGSSATFEKVSTYEIEISTAPILLDITSPTEIGNDGQVSFTLDMTSNSTEELQNVLLVAEYPFGFRPTEATPEVVSGTNNVWSLGDFDPEEQKSVTLSGTLEAQNNEERTFRFSIGNARQERPEEIGAIFLTSARTVAVNASGLALTARVSGSNAQEVVIQAGNEVQANLSWINNLSEELTNARVTALLSGDLIIRNSVDASSGGLYRPDSDTILWESSAMPSLRSIRQGEGGNVDFSFSTETVNTALSNGVRNPELTLEMSIQGTRLSAGNVPETITAASRKTIRVATNLDLTTRALRSLGPIENMGPLPPRANQTTTYTIVWSLTNTFNEATNTQVVATLPSYVEWEGIVSPSSAQIEYDPLTRQIIWNPSRVAAGAGFNGSPEEVAFRVALTPTASQIGVTPTLIEETRVRARDAFTGITLSDAAQALTTNLTNDPGVSFSETRVVE